MNEARNMQTAARRELDEYNRKVAEKKAQQTRNEEDVPPSSLVDQSANDLVDADSGAASSAEEVVEAA